MLQKRLYWPEKTSDIDDQQRVLHERQSLHSQHFQKLIERTGPARQDHRRPAQAEHAQLSLGEVRDGLEMSQIPMPAFRRAQKRWSDTDDSPAFRERPVGYAAHASVSTAAINDIEVLDSEKRA
jgi:hypothetical protein